MNRQEAEDYVYASYLRAERCHSYDSRDAEKRHPSLTRPLIESLQHAPCVAVTGSKGKGSVANMMAAILQTRHRVGLMTSPHIAAFNERFRVDGTPISDEDFVRTVEALKPSFDRIEASLPPDVCISPMGIQAAAGLYWFNARQTTFNVFELGKGARYDDVNNIDAPYAVINPIFLEHTRELGDTLESIAEDKACIIKRGQSAVFVARQQPAVMAVIEKAAREKGVPVRAYGRDFYADNVRFTEAGMVFDVAVGEERFPDIRVPLLGEHQAENCALAMAVCREILPDWDLDRVRQQLARLEWPGRMEVLSRSPLMILDACINRSSTAAVKDVLAHLGIGKCVFVVGIPDDKDYEGVVASVQDRALATILTRSGHPHYRFTGVQKTTLQARGIPVTESDSVREAIALARQYQAPVVILGTTSVIADVKAVMAGNLNPATP